MPIYEYECETCGARFERLQSIQDAPVRQCPECSGSVRKVLHAAGIIFKGSGWYITDSRKSASGTVAGEGKPATTDAKPNPPTDKPAETTSPANAKTENKTEIK
jgi:putative FmdB family regulatory protein